jgi:pyridinium-3,5-biscarboxylic acid mononucleotide synthase
MDPRDLKRLLASVRGGRLSIDSALERLRGLPFEDLGYAKVDHHRALRAGFPEVIFAQGKTPEQVQGIARAIAARRQPLLATRVAESQVAALREAAPKGEWHAAARLFRLGRARAVRGARVAVVSAGTADQPVAEEAALTAESLGCAVDRHYDLGVAGLQRLLARRAEIERARALVVVAGMEGALASVVGGLSRRPIIAVPTSVGYGVHLGGLTALFGMLNSCAANVSAVNVDNGFGGGFNAALIARRDP